MTDPRPAFPMRYAIGGVVLAMALNLALRSLVKVGGLLATLIIAGAVALLLAGAFRFIQRRVPSRGEAWRILLGYGALLGVLYLGLLGMMTLQDQPSPMAVFLFFLHYLCYPVLAWLTLLPRR